MGRQITVEVCLDSLASAIIVRDIAQEFGGRVKWRIELCSNLIHGGGLTPSIGLVRTIHSFLPSIDMMVMIRPRTGNFVYTETETRTMREDMIASREEAGVAGFVMGCLTSSGEIDHRTLATLAGVARDLPITFHRAFDMIRDEPTKAMDTFGPQTGTSGIKRILTSGQARTAPEGVKMIKALVETNDSPKILPGSGLNRDNLAQFLADVPDLTEIHLTASEAVDDGLPKELQEKSKMMGFGGTQVWKVNEEKLRAVFRIIDELGQA